jgi:hypothetical protein
MVGSDPKSCTGHVLYDDRGVSRDMFSHMPGDGPRVSIVASSSRSADDNADGLAPEEGFLAEKGREGEMHYERRNGQKPNQDSKHT